MSVSEERIAASRLPVDEWKEPAKGEAWAPDDCVRALCQLAEEVMKAFEFSGPSDCFCGYGGYSRRDGTVDPSQFNNYGGAIRFMRKATREALDRARRTTSATYQAEEQAREQRSQIIDEALS